MYLQRLVGQFKKAFTFEKPSEMIFECINCGEKFDGCTVELFIKHQIDEKHYDARKYKKNN